MDSSTFDRAVVRGAMGTEGARIKIAAFFHMIFGTKTLDFAITVNVFAQILTKSTK